MIKVTFTNKSNGKQNMLAGRLATVGVNAGLMALLFTAARHIPSNTKDAKEAIGDMSDALAVWGCGAMLGAGIALVWETLTNKD